jgi:5-hydroxyisourate hydrolase-like protein (transthyretin family)
MKRKLFILIVAVSGSLFTYANVYDPRELSNGKKDDVNGTVLNGEDKKPIEGVSITAILSSKKEMVVQTDEDGNYVFDELKPGIYKFVFEKTGYKKITKEKVVVKTDEAFLLKVEMLLEEEIDLMPSPFHF